MRQLKENFEKKENEYFPPEKKTLYQKNFYIFDRDQDELINFNELKELIVSLNIELKEEQIYKELYSLLETKHFILGTYGINFNSCLLILSKEMKDKDIQNLLFEAFYVLDQESLGYVESERLRELLMYNGFKYDEEQVECFMKEADPKGEGKVYYFDFISKIISREIPKKKRVPKPK